MSPREFLGEKLELATASNPKNAQTAPNPSSEYELLRRYFFKCPILSLIGMPYKFTFDISKAPHHLFTEIAVASYQRGVHKVFLRTLQDIIRRFRIQEATGLNLQDAVVLIQDLIDIQAANFMTRRSFLQTKKRALFLPHCSRKYMDGRCKAVFDANIPSYVCQHCSPCQRCPRDRVEWLFESILDDWVETWLLILPRSKR